LVCKIVKQIHNDIEREKYLGHAKEIFLHILYCELKQLWCKENEMDYECAKREKWNNMAESRNMEAKRIQEMI